jgi:hypothetical protein
VEEVRVSPAAIGSREDRITGPTLVVDDVEKWQRYQYEHRGPEREEEKQCRGITRKRNAGDEGIEEGAQSKRCEGKGRCRPAVRRPVECCFASQSRKLFGD